MSKAALVVGINYYEKQSNLKGCVNDAKSITKLLRYNENGEKNFEVRCLCAEDIQSAIKADKLQQQIKELFENRHNETALLYFSGHGGITPNNGGYIATRDTNTHETGISMADLIEIVNTSKVRNKIIIFDTCHSGEMGVHPSYKNLGSCIGEGVSILTASSQDQKALENNDLFNEHGVFSKLLIDSLEGCGSSILGQVTLGGIYAHIDKSLGNFGQRPIFKTNTNRFIEIRKVISQVNLQELRELSNIFTEPTAIYKLDQTYEQDKDVPATYTNKKACNPEHYRVFRILQNLNRVNIVVAVEEKDMYYAAMNEKACKLTSTGRFYWHLAKTEKL